MPLTRQEDWVRIAELDDQNQIRFTAEFQALVSDLGWEAKDRSGDRPHTGVSDYSARSRRCSASLGA